MGFVDFFGLSNVESCDVETVGELPPFELGGADLP